MNSIIEKLELSIKGMKLTVLDRRDDGFTYAIAVRHEKGIFVVYTTKGIYHYRRDGSCLRVLQASEHLPFAQLDPWPGGDFIAPYTIALTYSGKCIANYGNNFCVEEIPALMEHAAVSL